jgi:predicted transposase/invertase (TIGR01784 family)
LFDSAEIANFTPEEKVKYELSMRTERDLRNQIAFAKEEGFEIGRQEGRQEGIREVARRLLSLGVSLKTVAEGTGLSEEEVSLLAQES